MHGIIGLNYHLKKCLHRHQIVKHVNNDVGLFMILYSKCYRMPNDYNRSKINSWRIKCRQTLVIVN